MKKGVKLVLIDLTKLSKNENKLNNLTQNYLSKLVLNIFVNVSIIESNKNSKHVLYSLLINCFLINFKCFVNSSNYFDHLLSIFNLIMDLILVNSKIPENDSNNSYLNIINNYKIKNQISTLNNDFEFQLILYYLLQLLFVCLELKLNIIMNFKNFEKLINHLNKILAFLILNSNPVLIRLFRTKKKSIIKSFKILKTQCYKDI